MIAARDGEAVAVHRARSLSPSPLRYDIDSRDLIRIMTEIEEDGLELGAIYHSHTRSDPVPSQTDINLAFYPDSLYVIVGLAGAEPDVRAWEIRDRQVTERSLEVVA
jgi:[CysO sulfur-carrier protein]-S-L-cysteine hydrolase